MYRSLALSSWLTLLLAVLAGTFLVRMFIIFHDCGHGSFFLSRRGTGDVWTMTVQEYLESSRWKRSAYRLARNPILLFVVRQRFPQRRRARESGNQ